MNHQTSIINLNVALEVNYVIIDIISYVFSFQYVISNVVYSQYTQVQHNL